MKKTRIEQLTDFKNDLKKLVKKFRTPEEDLQTFIQYQLNLFHLMNQDSSGIKRISGLGINKPEIYKARKFACKSLKGRGVKSGIRIIYAYFKDEYRFELVEIYFKGDNSSEDRNRIRKLYG